MKRCMITRDRHVDTSPTDPAELVELGPRGAVRVMSAGQAHRLDKRRVRREKSADKPRGHRQDRRATAQKLRSQQEQE